MILTGIAEVHFWYWIDNSKKYNSTFRQLIRRWKEPILIHGLIVEWFDSKGIWKDLFDDMICNVLDGENHPWSYIIERTIERANQIYNEINQTTAPGA